MNNESQLTKNFLRLLGSGRMSIPKSALWLVTFEDLRGCILPGALEAIRRQKTYNTDDEWKIEAAAKSILNVDLQHNAGCVFCTAIGLPGEEITVNPAGSIQANSFIQSYGNQGRTMFPKMRMTFLETNVSFADNFLRPWVISTGTFGLIGRKRKDLENYRTTIYCTQLGSFSPDSPRITLKTWTFFDACCVSVNEEEYNYNPANAPVLREATFIYNSYKISSETNPFPVIN
jgi:hypothetical protein